MNVIDTWDKLLEVFAGLLLFQSGALDDNIKQLTTLYKLHDKIQVFFCLDNLIDLYNIRMMQLFKYFNLPADSFYILFVFNSTFLENFYSHLK